MEAIYIYLLKASIALILFYGFYRLMIFQNTFFKVRRFTLLAILAFSALYPLIDLVEWMWQKEPIQEMLMPYVAEIPEMEITATPVTDSTFPIEMVGMVLYGVIALLLAVRMLFQFCSILWLKSRARPGTLHHQPIHILPDNPIPFSFFHWIFMNPALTSSEDALRILTHEQTHVRQYHSLDVLLGELFSIIFWFNPFAWLLKREIRINLEHLADDRVIESGAEASSYQYALLRLCHHTISNKLVNNFNIPQFKRRIIMMNKNKSNRNSLMRYALLLPVAGLLIISGNVQAVISKVRTELTQNPTKQQVNETVSGIVVTSDDKPLMGANIIIKGTHNGTISDKEGRFSLPMEPGQQLHISYVGMKTVLITPKPNQKDLKVMMVDEPVYQEELVVVGYGEQKKLPAAAQKENSKEDPIFTVVEDMPSFPGGEQALMQYLAKNIKYPVIAQENGIEGRVIVAYIVGADGKITSPEIVRGVDPALDKEALRIVENMPVWKPGKQRGKAVAVRYVLPITFRLQGKGDGAATPATKK